MNRLLGQRIAVLAGGPSCEREISLISGRCVLDALQSKGLSAFLLDPIQPFIDRLREERTTLVFNALHGTFGEDGTVQRLLDREGISYTGCGAFTSELAFDKARAQALFARRGIRVPEYCILKKEDGFVSRPALPLVVKPSKAGSSVGIALVAREDQYEKAVLEAFRYSDTVLVERYVEGRELTVGILADQPLPIVEVIVQRSFYDYEAKYGNSGTRYDCPARLARAQATQVSKVALETYRAIGGEVMGRVDIILGKDGRPYVLEINTIPGLTGKSLLPKAARAAGIDFAELCVKILNVSLDKKSASETPGRTPEEINVGSS